MLNKISLLREVLADSVLTSADRIAIRNEMGDLQDKVALLDFQECEDIDYGYHAQYDFWHKSLNISRLAGPAAGSHWLSKVYRKQKC